MEVEQLTIPKKKAAEAFQNLKQAFKQNATLKRDEIRRDLQRVYGHMSHGKKVVDLYESFKRTGVNSAGEPKLAIVRADSKEVCCRRNRDGSARFFHDNGGQRIFELWDFRMRVTGGKDDVKVPAGTFTWKEKSEYGLHIEPLQTIVPIIPAHILVNEVKVLLRNFHILWEVDEWKPIPPRDPILLKRLTPNLFGVLATWDLTELERAVIRGRIT